MNLLLVADHCPTCGRDFEDPEEPGRYYCIDCGRQIAPLPETPLQAEIEDLPRIASEMKADWYRAQFRVITGEAL